MAELRDPERHRRNDRSDSAIDFAKKVGIVAGAFLAVVACSNVMFRAIMRPITEQITFQVSEERRARVTGDSLLMAARARSDSSLAVALSSISGDRIAMLTTLAVIEEPNPDKRGRLIETIRRMWRRR